MVSRVVIVSATRTPVGKYGGSLKDAGPASLGSVVLHEVLERGGLEARDVGEVIMGNVLSAGHGQNLARQAAVLAGIPYQVPAYCVNKVCGSGLKSVVLGAQSIMLGEAEAVLAGGIESMSQAPHALKRMRWGARMGNDEAVDLMVYDGLLDIFNNCHMGVIAENIAERYGVTREDQDAFAAQSQNRAEAAIRAGKFREEIVPVGDFDTDEFPRFGTTGEVLARLKPAFKEGGTVTAGNSSGINDGAAAVLLMSGRMAEERGIKPLAAIAGYGSSGVPPEVMGIGPVSSTGIALERAGIGVGDLGLVELNEAFAAQSVAVIRTLGLDAGKVNVNGGAIALGHPIGASGTRILVTLLHEMRRRDVTHGLAALCVGGGQGISLVVER